MNPSRHLQLLLAVLLSGISGCGQKHSEDDEVSRSPVTAVVAVKAASITRGDIDVVVTATGKTDALRKVKIISPIAGRVQSLNVVEGTPVKVGDVLAVIQSREAHAAIAGAEELLQSARTPEEKREAERSLSLARSTQNSVIVRARSAGIVGTRSVNEGEVVAEDAELLTLVDLSTVDFLSDVLLRDLPSVHRGQQATVQFPSLPGRAFAAQVEAIYPQTDEQSQTATVRLRFLDRSSLQRPLLRTDIAGVAHIMVGLHRNAFIAPRGALLRDDENDTYTIVTITQDSLWRSVPVSVGELTDSTAEIAGDGIHPGMPVITSGNYALPDSTRVSVETP